MPAIKPIIIVNERDYPFILQKSRPEAAARKVIKDGEVAEEVYELRKPAERLEIPPSLDDDFDKHGTPGYVVMKSGTWGEWTGPQGYPDLEAKYAQGRKPILRVLRGSAADRFVAEYGIDVDVEAI